MVVDWAALDPGPIRRVRDLPGGGDRLVADQPRGIVHIVVNGVPITADGHRTVADLDRLPGQVLDNGPETGASEERAGRERERSRTSQGGVGPHGRSSDRPMEMDDLVATATSSSRPTSGTGRVPDHLADRAPRVVVEDDGEWWYIDGRKTMSHLGIQTGARFEGDPDKLVTSATFDQVRPAAYDPRAYLEENETDGVWGSVIYPSEGLVMFSVPNTEVVSASMKAYNDWLAEFCSEDPVRLKGLAMVNVDDIDDAVAEFTRVRDARTRRRAHHGEAADVGAVPLARVRPALGVRAGPRPADQPPHRNRPRRSAWR